MYHTESAQGGSAAFWEKAWSDGAFEEALRFCEVDPLGPLLRRYARPGLRILEGGCGRGQYVAYYTRRGAHVVGLDFAREALSDLHARDPHLRLCVGDVGALPFRSAAFDVYYSGGVVEHFEQGPEASLHEARRVLRDDGALLVSVPYLSPLRSLLSRFKGKDRRRLRAPALDPPGARRTFYQYAFTRREFERTLRQCGFRVQAVQGYAIAWGLSEMPGAARLLDLVNRSRGARAGAAAAGARTAAATPAPARVSWLKRLVVSEDERLPVIGRLIPFLRWSCANMIMFVCVPAATTAPSPR